MPFSTHLKSLKIYHWPGRDESRSAIFARWYCLPTKTKATKFFWLPLTIWQTTAVNWYDFRWITFETGWMVLVAEDVVFSPFVHSIFISFYTNFFIAFYSAHWFWPENYSDPNHNNKFNTNAMCECEEKTPINLRKTNMKMLRCWLKKWYVFALFLQLAFTI